IIHLSLCHSNHSSTSLSVMATHVNPPAFRLALASPLPSIPIPSIAIKLKKKSKLFKTSRGRVPNRRLSQSITQAEVINRSQLTKSKNCRNGRLSSFNRPIALP
ncbi:Uncharacterized protein TCM_011207, partial [Theobroma cacao]